MDSLSRRTSLLLFFSVSICLVWRFDAHTRRYTHVTQTLLARVVSLCPHWSVETQRRMIVGTRASPHRDVLSYRAKEREWKQKGEREKEIANNETLLGYLSPMWAVVSWQIDSAESCNLQRQKAKILAALNTHLSQEG